LDAGPLVAVLNPRDQWHATMTAAWPDLMARCVTTEAVVTEASHLMLRGGGLGRAWAPLDFLMGARIPVLPMEPAAHRRAVRLMRQYENLPMDYGDATLVVLAEALAVNNVFTTDRRGFSSYPAPRGAHFTLLPSP
jgi:predicted nucleic acid-binding protein